MPRRSKAAPAVLPATERTTLESMVEDLGGDVRALGDRVEVLRIAIDDLRQELEWVTRNLSRLAPQTAQPVRSMSADPLAEDFAINRVRQSDIQSAASLAVASATSKASAEPGRLF
jgi:hypothetical protein